MRESRSVGTQQSASRIARGHSGGPPGQGPFMTVTLQVTDGLIREATFDTYPCPGSVACGKSICELASGKSLDEARAIRHEHLLERVGPLPAYRRHCYGLALLALSEALKQASQV